MATKRYVVTHAFYYTFGKEPEPTWITRENADIDIPRMATADRESYVARGYITEVTGAPSVEEQPILQVAAPLAPIQQLASTRVASPAAATATTTPKRKGGE